MSIILEQAICVEAKQSKTQANFGHGNFVFNSSEDEIKKLVMYCVLAVKPSAR